MSRQAKREDGTRPVVSRRGLLKTGAAAGAAAAALLIAPKIGGTGTVSAAPGLTQEQLKALFEAGVNINDPEAVDILFPATRLSLDVAADLGGFEIVETPASSGQGPFYVGGAITGDGTGRFHCWGYIHAGGAVVTQEYDLDGRGKIMVAGVEDSGPRAVIGGTGDFDTARGEMSADLSEFPGNPNFTAIFALRG
jgi:hypothetical protein